MSASVLLANGPRRIVGICLLAVLLFASRAAAEAGGEQPRTTTPETEQKSPAANAQEGTRWTFSAMFRRGGYMMYLILLCSVVGLGFTIERIISLQRKRHLPERLAERVIERALDEDPNAGAVVALEAGGSLGRLLAGALRRAGTSRQEMTQGVLDESGRLQYDLRRNTRVLGVCSSVSPLLGLLGTVVGMIKAFEGVKAEGLGRGAGEQIAGGISEALLTTGAGLTVAIPCFLLYQFFKGRGDDIVREAEEIAENFVLEYQRRSETTTTARRESSARPQPAPAATDVAAASGLQDKP